MKQTVDALRDVGHLIEDHQVVLKLLNGLNPRLANTTDIITNTKPLLTFTSAINMLRLKELHLAKSKKVASNSTLAISSLNNGGLHLCILPLLVLARSLASQRWQGQG